MPPLVNSNFGPSLMNKLQSYRSDHFLCDCRLIVPILSTASKKDEKQNTDNNNHDKNEENGENSDNGSMNNQTTTLEFPAHRVILSASSPIFRDMFHLKSHETMTKVEVMEGSPGAVEVMLQYVYSGQLQLGSCNPTDLLQLATMFQITSLQDILKAFEPATSPTTTVPEDNHRSGEPRIQSPLSPSGSNSQKRASTPLPRLATPTTKKYKEEHCDELSLINNNNNNNNLVLAESAQQNNNNNNSNNNNRKDQTKRRLSITGGNQHHNHHFSGGSTGGFSLTSCCLPGLKNVCTPDSGSSGSDISVPYGPSIKPPKLEPLDVNGPPMQSSTTNTALTPPAQQSTPILQTSDIEILRRTAALEAQRILSPIAAASSANNATSSKFQAFDHHNIYHQQGPRISPTTNPQNIADFVNDKAGYYGPLLPTTPHDDIPQGSAAVSLPLLSAAAARHHQNLLLQRHNQEQQQHESGGTAELHHQSPNSGSNFTGNPFLNSLLLQQHHAAAPTSAAAASLNHSGITTSQLASLSQSLHLQAVAAAVAAASHQQQQQSTPSPPNLLFRVGGGGGHLGSPIPTNSAPAPAQTPTPKSTISGGGRARTPKTNDQQKFGGRGSTNSNNGILIAAAEHHQTTRAGFLPPPSACRTVTKIENSAASSTGGEDGSGDAQDSGIMVPSNDKEGWCRNKKYIQKVVNGFKCTVCNKVYGRYNSVSYHVTIYHRNPPIKCDEPGCQFTTREARYIHFHKYYRHGTALPNSIDLGSRSCPFCRHVAKSPAMLEKHVGRHIPELIRSDKIPGGYKCHHCEKDLSTQKMMVEHMLSEHSSPDKQSHMPPAPQTPLSTGPPAISSALTPPVPSTSAALRAGCLTGGGTNSNRGSPSSVLLENNMSSISPSSHHHHMSSPLRQHILQPPPPTTATIQHPLPLQHPSLASAAQAAQLKQLQQAAQQHQHHQHDDHSPPVHHCDQCSYKGQTSDSLIQHKLFKHSKDLFKHKHTCATCGYSSSSRQNLEAHQKREHNPQLELYGSEGSPSSNDAETEEEESPTSSDGCGGGAVVNTRGPAGGGGGVSGVVSGHGGNLVIYEEEEHNDGDREVNVTEEEEEDRREENIHQNSPNVSSSADGVAGCSSGGSLNDSHNQLARGDLLEMDRPVLVNYGTL